jgi:predicted aspartyl protease
VTISRRALVSRAVLAAAAGATLFAVRDRLPWPPLDVRFANGRDTPWLALPKRAGLVEIAATVNGAPIRAVVDSGAQLTAIDAGLAARLGLQRILAAPLLAYGVSGRPSLTHTVRLDLGASGLVVRGLRAAVLDLAGIAAASGREFHLLIGRDVLSRLVIEVDFPRRRARFLAPGRYAPAYDAVTIPLSGGAPTARVQIEAAPPLQLLIDTGATGFLALSESAARQAGLTGPGRSASQGLSVSLSGLNPERTVHAHTVRIGGLTLRDIPVQVYAPVANAPAPAGLIGSGLLRPFRVALDLPGRRLHLTRPPITIL